MTTPTVTVRCAGCHKRLGPTIYALQNNHACCAHCVDSDGLHAQLWPDCTAAWHQPLDHLVDITFNGTSTL
jgi:recombinational DNA repair protein (RecF pathway)